MTEWAGPKACVYRDTGAMNRALERVLILVKPSEYLEFMNEDIWAVEHVTNQVWMEMGSDKLHRR